MTKSLLLIGLAGSLAACAGASQTAERSASATGAPAAGAEAPGWTPAMLQPGSDVFLPDYSFAGYRWGEAPIPTSTGTVVRATDHGVVAGDGQDDTEALRQAVAAAGRVSGPVVVELPAGEVELRNLLFIERSQFVLRGAGSQEGGTVLSIPVPMDAMDQPPVLETLNTYLVDNDKKAENGDIFTPYSWTGGVVWTRVPEGTVRASASPIAEGTRGVRGAHTFTVESVGTLAPGAVVRLGWFNRAGPNSALLQHLYGKADGLGGARLHEEPETPLITQEVTVEAVDGQTVTTHEPLLHDLRPEWSAVMAAEARLEDVGIDGMRIVFPDAPDVLHHLERGYNGIYLTDLRNGWVRDVTIVNGDSGILTDFCSNLTLTGIRTSGRRAHYGVHLGDVERVLLTDFETTMWAHHPVSFNTGARQSVIAHGRVRYPQLDQHRGANHTNLYDDVETVEPGDEMRFFEHGGAGYWGPTHGVANTFWNVRLTVERPEAFPRNDDGALVLSGVSDSPAARIVGLRVNVPVEIDYPGAVIDGTGRTDLAVPSLYDYQLARRGARP